MVWRRAQRDAQQVVQFFLELDDDLRLLEAVLQSRVLTFEPGQTIAVRGRLLGGRPTRLGGKSGKPATLASAAPLAQVRRIEPFPSKQGADGTWLADKGVCLGKDAQLVLGSERAVVRPLERFVGAGTCSGGCPMSWPGPSTAGGTTSTGSGSPGAHATTFPGPAYPSNSSSPCRAVTAPAKTPAPQ